MAQEDLNTIVNFYSENFISYLNIFQNTISQSFFTDVFSGKITDPVEIAKLEEKSNAFAKKYFETVSPIRLELFISAAVEMDKYLNFYQVIPTNGEYDEFKGIYFFGMEISKRLKFLELRELNKFHLKAVLTLLDYRLETPYNIQRPILTERINLMIENDAIEDHLGMYGWYIIYKCLYNAEDEKSKLIN